MIAQPPAADPAYVVRGRQTEAIQRAFTARLEHFHITLANTLRRTAPDLLPRLDPPPPAVRTGYQLLPSIVSDASPTPPSKPQAVSFYWGWSDTLYERQTRDLGQLEADLAAVAVSPAGGSRSSTLESLIARYRTIVSARTSIDADVGYNWLWQSEIANNRARFDAATRLIDAALTLTAADAPLTSDILSAGAAPDPGTFVRVESPSRHVHVVTVLMVTDIVDDAFVERFKSAAEGHWALTASGEDYRVRLEMTRLSPERLYCGAPVTGLPLGSCAPPAKGERIDLETHTARFPPGRAVLTTGASALHARGRRVIALTPFDVAPRVLAHEVGHLLGFPDAYLRGYRDLGPEGFRVIEFVPDLSNIMAAPGAGSVKEQHFRQLIAAAKGR